MLIVYKNDRNVRFVLITKTSTVTHFHFSQQKLYLFPWFHVQMVISLVSRVVPINPVTSIQIA